MTIHNMFLFNSKLITKQKAQIIQQKAYIEYYETKTKILEAIIEEQKCMIKYHRKRL